jgi:hypothetical protein
MIKGSPLTLSLLALFIIHTTCFANYHLITLTDHPDALCLDGTRGAYYIYQGGQKNKFLLSFEGGGWCGSSVGLP